MITSQLKKDDRKISNKNHNHFMAEGVELHKSTKIAPLSLLQPFSTNQVQQLISKHKKITFFNMV